MFQVEDFLQQRMSENTDSRREGRGNARGGGASNVANCAQEGFGQQQQQQPFAQDFGSWRSAMPGPQASAAGLGPEAYNNFYYGSGYNAFAGDIRDSIAAIWSRTSPSGEGVPFSGGYGQFPDSSTGQFAANSTPAGQFAANLTGHFASTSDLGMFGTPGGEYSAYGQQYGYGPQYTQWPDGSGRGGYSYLGGGVQGGEDMRSAGQRDRVTDMHQGLENMKLGKGQKSGDSNGYQQQQPKKMSWANVASQPAKPQPLPAKAKKPGVLPPPTIIPSKPPVQLAPAPADKMSGPPPMPQQPIPPPKEPPVQPQGGPPPTAMPPNGPILQSSVPPPVIPGITSKSPQQQPPPLPDNRGGQSGVGPIPPGVAPPSNQGPRAARATANGVNSTGNGAAGILPGGPPPKSHPVLDTLRSMNEYNPKNFDLNPKNARFFVIKSFSEDDIHRSIKYEIWCSTDHGNKRLDLAYRSLSNKGPIYLLFSVNGSGHFCGVAEMLSPVDYSSTGSVWVQDKFKGQFKVKWIYVKDVPNGQLRHIRLENNENKPVTNSRDTQEVPPEKGKLVLKIIHSFKHTTSIFDDFVHYEKRQQEEEECKKAGNVSAIPGMNLKNESGQSHHGGHIHHHGGHRDAELHGGHHHRDGGRHNRGGGGMIGGLHNSVKSVPPPQAARN